MGRTLRHLLIASFLLSAGCAGPESLFAEQCANDNSNCKDPLVALSTKGAVVDLEPQLMKSGESTPQLSMKPARYGQEATLEYVLTNPRLVPLRAFELSLSPGDPSLSLLTDFEDGCGNVFFLFYSQSCRFRIVFKPGEASPSQDVLIKFKTLLGEPYELLSSLGPGVVLPDFTIDAADLNFSRHLVFAPSASGFIEREIDVVNYSPTPITNISIFFSASDSFTLIPGGLEACTDGQTLAANGGACKLKIRFKPETVGHKSASVTLVGSPLVGRAYLLSGEAVAVNAAPVPLDFGSRQLSTSSVTQTVQVTVPNTDGNPDAKSCSYNLVSESPQITRSSQACTALQAAGSTCDIEIQFTPDSQPGNHLGNLNVSCDDRGGDLTIPIYAQSTLSPILTDMIHIAFGELLLGSNATQTLTVTNASANPLTGFIQAISSPPESGIQIAGGTCMNTLAPQASCTITLQFAPLQAGVSFANLSLSAAGVDAPTNIPAAGHGLSIYPNQPIADLGATLEGKDTLGTDIRIINPSSTQSATGCRFEPGNTEENGFSFENGSDCLSTNSLPPGGSCVLKPRFTASLPYGMKEASVRLVCDIGGTAEIALKGETVESLTLVGVPPTQVDDKIRLVGITEYHVLRYTNMDPALPAGSVTVTAPEIASPWSLENAGANDCATIGNLLPGETCEIKLNYAPLATPGAEQTGTTSGQIIASANNANPAPLNYSGTAVKITPSVSTYDFAVVPTDTETTSATVFYIQNPSNMDTATGCNLSASAPLGIINSNCGSTLAPGEYCRFELRVPSLAQSTSLNGSWARMDCSVGGRAEIAVSGLVQKPAVLKWTGNSTFGTIDIGQSQTETFTLTHTGDSLDAAAFPLSLEFATGSSNAFSIIQNECPPSLAPGESCNVTVRFTPTSEDPVMAQLVAKNGVGTVYDTVNISGDGVDGDKRLTPSLTSVNISGRLVGVEVDTDIIFTNDAKFGSTSSITVGNPTSGTPWSLGASPAPCATLGVGEDCVVRLTFCPVIPGSTSGTVTVTASNVNAPRIISYAGSALKISTSTSTLNFGIVDVNVGKVHPTVVKITNPSSIDQASGCSLSIDPPFTALSNSCTTSLSNGAECSFQVDLPPQISEQTLIGQAQYSCAVGGTVTITLAAEIIELPDVRWAASPPPDFGEHDVGTPPRIQTFTLENFGATAAQLSGLTLVGSSSSFAITGGTCGPTALLGPGQTCTVEVRFNPTQNTTTSGGENAILRASITTPESANIDLHIAGTGTTMNLAAVPTSLQFTTREVGQPNSEEKTVILTNNGTRNAYLTYSSLGGSPFTHTGTCGAVLPPGNSCELKVLFAAAASVGSHSNKLTVTDTLNGIQTNVEIDLSAETLNAPILAGKDDLENANFEQTISTSDITGPLDHSRNIVDLNPAYRDVTFTLKNNASGASTLNSLAVTLSHQSGAAGTMIIVSDTCSDSTLSSGTCSITIRYTPTKTPETSVYSLKVEGTSATTGTVHEFKVENLVGNSVRSAKLTLVSPLEILGDADTQTPSAVYELHNEGDRTAELDFTFIGTDASAFMLDSSIEDACETIFAGGESCKIRLLFDPNHQSGTFKAQLIVTDKRGGMGVTSDVHGASYKETVVGNDMEGLEGDVVGDEDHYYVISRVIDEGTDTFEPILTICSRTAKGGINSCARNVIRSILTEAPIDGKNLAGDTINSGPRIQQSGKKIIFAVQNKDIGMQGDEDGGTATVIICQKPAPGILTLDAGSCRSFIVNENVRTGEYPGLAASDNKIVLSSMSGTDHTLRITVCSYDGSTDSTDETTLNLDSCRSEEIVTDVESGWYTSVVFNGSQAIIASYDEPVPLQGRLRLSACTITTDNQITNCNSQIVDDSAAGSLYPGAYPSIIRKDDKVYVAHQHGKLQNMRLRLTSCNIDSNNAFSSCFSQNVTNGAGTGNTPRIVMSGDNDSGRLWLTGVTLQVPTDTASFSRVGVYMCSLPLSSGSCSNVSSYYLQPTANGVGPAYSRSLWFDSIGKQLVIPFEASFYVHDRKLGIITLGLLPEL